MKIIPHQVRASGLVLGVAFSLLGVALARTALGAEASDGTVCGWVLPSDPVVATLTNATGKTCAELGVHRYDWARVQLHLANGKTVLFTGRMPHLLLRGDEFVHLALTWTRDGRVRLFVNGRPAVGERPEAKENRLSEGVGLVCAPDRTRGFRLANRAWTAAEVYAAYRRECPLDLVMDDALVYAGEPDEAEWILAPGGTYTFPKPAKGLKPVTASVEVSTSVRRVSDDESALVGPVLAETPFARHDVTKPIRLTTPSRVYAEGLYRLSVRLRRVGATNGVTRTLFFRAIPRTDLAKTPATKLPWRKTQTFFTKEFRTPADCRWSSGATVARQTPLGAYVEAGPDLENRFAAIVDVPKEAVGHPCLVEIDWPDDKPRAMGLYLYEIQRSSCRDHLQGGLVTGVEIPNTQTMQTRAYLYYPTGTNALFEARTFIAGRPAAVAKLTVSRLAEPLPVLAVRRPKAARPRTFGHCDEDQTFDNNITASPYGLLNATVAEALTNLIAYCGYTGQNAFSYSPLRYANLNFGLIDQETRFGLFPREQGAWKGVVRELHRNGISFFAQQRAPTSLAFAYQNLTDNDFAARGLLLRKPDGSILDGSVYEGGVGDIASPEVREILSEELIPVLAQMADAKADAIEIYLEDDISNATTYPRAEYGEQDPAKRRAVATRATKEFVDRLRAVAPQPMLNVEVAGDADTVRRRGYDVEEIVRALPEARLMVLRGTTHYYRRLFWAGSPADVTKLDELYHPDAPELTRLAKLSPGGSLPVVQNAPEYFETFVKPLGDDPRFQNYFQDADVKPHGRWFLRDPSYCLAKADVLDYAVGMQPLGSLGNEAETREWTQAYCALPALPFKTMPGDGDPVVGRWLETDEGTYVYAVNWSLAFVEASLVSAPCLAEDLSTGEREDLSRLTLKPFELRSFLLPKGAAAPDFRVVARADDTSVLDARLAEVERMLADFAREKIDAGAAQAHVAKAKDALAKGRIAAAHYWLFTCPVNAMVMRHAQFDDVRDEARMHRDGRYAVSCAAATFMRAGGRLFSPDRTWDGQTYGRVGNATVTARNVESIDRDAPDRDLFKSEAYGLDAYKMRLPAGRYRVKLYARWGYPAAFENPKIDLRCAYFVNGKNVSDGYLDFRRAQGGDIGKTVCLETVADVKDALTVELKTPEGGDTSVRLLNAIEAERISE